MNGDYIHVIKRIIVRCLQSNSEETVLQLFYGQFEETIKVLILVDISSINDVGTPASCCYFLFFF